MQVRASEPRYRRAENEASVNLPPGRRGCRGYSDEGRVEDITTFAVAPLFNRHVAVHARHITIVSFAFPGTRSPLPTGPNREGLGSPIRIGQWSRTSSDRLFQEFGSDIILRFLQHPLVIQRLSTSPVHKYESAMSGSQGGEQSSLQPCGKNSGTKEDQALRKILLVDDNPMNIQSGTRLLSLLGYQVHSASNGHQAIIKACATRFDLILMDCHMPGLDGLSATRKIRECQGYFPGRLGDRPVPIIALTTNLSELDEAACSRSGMDGVLPKPLQIDALELTLLAFIE
ncbi:hypothetical protein MJO28_004759 [Puccinia striiformis f. sp. tritici]|uniref:Uncharacterized protein n=1 Tax=Puccinia striiformis f. sp. tritici TaxID=168172 RepID=A0ACC0EIR8_9BASI|nr:hypothetical protein MJO28_004759 [Puccinia striiformis f. sp. tritici]